MPAHPRDLARPLPTPAWDPREEWVTPLASLCTNPPTPVTAAKPLVPPGMGRAEWGGLHGVWGPLHACTHCPVPDTPLPTLSPHVTTVL